MHIRITSFNLIFVSVHICIGRINCNKDRWATTWQRMRNRGVWTNTCCSYSIYVSMVMNPAGVLAKGALYYCKKPLGTSVCGKQSDWHLLKERAGTNQLTSSDLIFWPMQLISWQQKTILQLEMHILCAVRFALVNISISRYTYTYLLTLANAHSGVNLAHFSAVAAHVTATEEDGRNYFGVCIDSGLAIQSVAGAKGRGFTFWCAAQAEQSSWVQVWALFFQSPRIFASVPHINLRGYGCVTHKTDFVQACKHTISLHECVPLEQH